MPESLSICRRVTKPQLNKLREGNPVSPGEEIDCGNRALRRRSRVQQGDRVLHA